MVKKRLSLFVVGFLVFSVAQATPATDQLLDQYKKEGAGPSDIEHGKAFWTRRNDQAGSEKNSCQACHGKDLTQQGKHVVTLKVIQPMSPRVNKERFNDPEKIEKWFKRNCRDVWGRQCTAQEKTDILSYLLTQ